MGNAINKWIVSKNPNSLLKDTGQKIVASAQHSNVSPFLIVSIAYQESGLANPSDFNVSHGHNSFGRSAGAGQPSFQGARSWYYWTSVPASVDYTAPENQNIPGGGDMATYLRNQYGKEIDANSGFYNIIILYAPNSDGNDPTGYAKGINDHVQEMIDLTNGTASTPSNGSSNSSTTTPSNSCSCSGTPSNNATVVIDAGHSGIDKSITDPQTGLIDHDYPNFPEITQVFTIAQDLQKQLTTAGYKVVMTKQNVMDYVSLRSRADIANQANAAIAVSIHDDGGQSYNTFQQIYDQRVGEYRTNPQGQNTTFTDKDLADKSASFAQIFQQTRQAAQGIKPDIVENNYSNRPGLSPGNLALVQLLSKVPWIYNETGSLNISDSQLAAYEKGILDGIEKSVPLNSKSSQASSGGCGVSCNSTSTDTSVSQVRQNVVCLAIQELNTWKSQPGYPWQVNNTYAESGYLKYSQNRHEQWCADFASWLYDQSKYPLRPDPGWNIAYVPNIQAVGQENKNFHWHPESSYTPKPGDLAIHGSGHVNVVEKVSGSSVTYIGGDQGHPDFPGGSIVSEGTINGFHSDGVTGFVSPD
jgi:hypothetical protein